MISSYLVVFKQMAVKLLLVGAVIGLAACGGDDGGNKPTPTPTPTPEPDTTPADFTLSLPQATYERGAVASTEQVTITDIDTLTDISISSGGEYSIDSGSFTSSAGQIANNQTVVARATAGGNFDDEVAITLTVGTVEKSFTVVTEAQDTLPDNFAPAATQTGVLRSSDFTFPEFTIAGITGEVSLGISGGVYALNGGDFGTSAATVTAGDTIAVRLTAASDFSTTSSATLTIGTGEGVFSIESEAEDVNPDPFELGDNATVSTAGQTAESQIITIAGINAAANISILNGEYRIEGVQDYGNSSSTVAPGQQVQVRVTAGSQLNITETATLTIGDQSDTFGVSLADQTAPSAEVVFPTANTMSNGSYVTLRGKASDDFGPVTQIQVTVTTDAGTVEVDNETITAGTGEDFQDTWSVQVDLASEKLNTIQVLATDAGGNVQETPVTLTVLQSANALSTNFPEGNDVYTGGLSGYRGIEWDSINNRLFIPRRSPEQILSIDINTGTRSVFVDEAAEFSNFTMLKILPNTDSLLVGDQHARAIFEFDLNELSFKILTDMDNLNSNSDISSPFSMELGSNGQLFVADAGARFYSVDMETGNRTLISNSSRPSGGVNPFTNPTGLILDEANDRALISDATTQQLIWVNLTTGERTVWVDSDQLEFPFDIKLDENNNRVILSDSQLPSILSVDWSTGVVSVISSNSIPAGDANSLQNPYGIVLNEANNIAFIVSESLIDSGYAAVLLIDLNSGERIILTNSVE
ncbi:hypothetical protein P886_3341 [Alteromonadaceae bacterium 2753L.S.0a.02]|nr:hypothetical protein P886_3341 [Alteromonadaceae bacterium 2753L.S.0a.02]